MSPLNLEEVLPDPIAQFRVWFKEADAATVAYVNAMVLSTHGLDGFPDSRVVLLKEVTDSAFVFFTNTRSMKGQELAANSRVALNFYWDHMRRQVRIQGSTKLVTAEAADSYFKTRSRLSQLGARASRQSQPLPDRRTLELAVAHLEHEFQGREVPRPEHWSGYEVTPHKLEFWQEREGRLHDRFEYRRTETSPWCITRLSP